MNNIKFFLKIITYVILIGCGSKDAEVDLSPDINIDESSENESIDNKNFIDNNDFSNDRNIERNMPAIIEDLRKDIKKLNAELDYQNENLSK